MTFILLYLIRHPLIIPFISTPTFSFLFFIVIFLCTRELVIYCMASSLNTTRGIGKRVATQIWSHPPTPSNHLPFLPVRRVATASVYDKNPEDHNPHTAVPDEVIRPESDKYWAPHPQTGVFGPASGHKTTGLDTKPANARESSVLEHAAWFRPTSLEDLEKPLQS